MIRAALLGLALLPLSLVGLAACGLTPVYGGQGASYANSGPIQISEIRATSSEGAASGRTGHFLRQELVRTVGQGVPGFTSGTLDVDLRQSIELAKLVKAIGVGVNEWQVCHAALQQRDFDCFLLAGRYTLLEQDALDAFLPRIGAGRRAVGRGFERKVAPAAIAALGQHDRWPLGGHRTGPLVAVVRPLGDCR